MIILRQKLYAKKVDSAHVQRNMKALEAYHTKVLGESLDTPGLRNWIKIHAKNGIEGAHEGERFRGYYEKALREGREVLKKAKK